MATTLGNTHTTLNLYANDPIETDDGSFGQYSNTFGLLSYKLNFTLNHQLPFLHTTAVYLPILNLKRNGPYGYPSWKQIRAGENTISRTHRKNNILTFVNHPVEKIMIQNEKRYVVSHRDDTIQYYDEPPVVAKHKPLEVLVLRPLREGGSPFPVTIKADFNNGINMMTNKEVNAYAKAVTKEPESYNTLKSMYLNGALEDPSSPISGFSYLKFSQTVFPAEKRTFKFENRVRTSFPSGEFWKDKRYERSANADAEPQASDGFFFNGAHENKKTNRSVWPLDVSQNWATRTDNPLVNNANILFVTQSNGTGIGGSSERADYGILQNNYNNFISGGIVWTGLGENATYGGPTRPAPLYNRKHNLLQSSSVVSATGRSDLTPTSNMSLNDAFAGEAAWDAPAQAGRGPFDDSIDVFAQHTKSKYKNYGIIPEYKINSHIDFYLENGIKKENLDLFELPGGGPGGIEVDISSETDFYKIYSTSDFLENFNIIAEDHKGFASPSSVKLTCNAVLKLMPYKGFYPAQRSVDLAESFYDSYKSGLMYKTTPDGPTQFGQDFIQGPGLYDKPFLQPLFSPGIWFNTIKSGIACDFTIPTGSIRFLSGGANPSTTNGLFGIGSYRFNNNIDDVKYSDLARLPFETMLEPESYLKGIELFDNEPHYSASFYPNFDKFTATTGYTDAGNLQIPIIWNGEGKKNYKKMANNFLSEIADFFLENKNLTTYQSFTQDNPNFGNLEKGKKYSMRIELGKTFKNGRPSVIIPASARNTSTGLFDKTYSPPSFDKNLYNASGVGFAKRSRENITMYSRPSAFGPNISTTTTDVGSGDGLNGVWTPPYYDGASYVDISIEPTQTKKYNIQEILNESAIEYHRYEYLGSAQFSNLNVFFMQASASLNIFKTSKPLESNLLFISSGSNGAGIQDGKSRLSIQTKFETPILNFNSVDLLTVPQVGSASVPRGMWHQYGSIPKNDEMIYLEIKDIPQSWYIAREEDPDVRYSLADTLGFEKSRRRLGELAKSKTIKEAVVAVPFYDEGSNRKFFRIPRLDIENATGNEEQQKLVGSTILEMVDKIKQYNFPPSMDFLTYKDIDPFAMYIFEFEHVLSREDLSYIWQNLAPDIGLEHKESSATITHELLAHELLGGGSKIINTGGGKILDVHAKGDDLNPEIRWMVFKVKYKAKHDYYEKIIGKRSKLDVKTANINYNWPYDFFSLVELVKLDASVEFSQIEKDELTGIRKLKPINSPNPMPVTRNFRNGIKKK